MKESQAERLLKLAETDPELAHKIADFINESNNKPFDKGITKEAEDKLIITKEQKKWLYCLTGTFITGFILTICWSIGIFASSSDINPPTILFGLFFTTILSTITLCWFFAFKAGIPTAKQFLSKYFEVQ